MKTKLNKDVDANFDAPGTVCSYDGDPAKERREQRESPARVSTDLTTGKISAKDFDPDARDSVEQPNAGPVTETLAVRRSKKTE